MTVEPMCELCTAAQLTERYFDDDLCWVAECEACFVPMVVWKHHDPNPPEEIRAELLQRLTTTAETFHRTGWWIDETMRSIPYHYHAHARRRYS